MDWGQIFGFVYMAVASIIIAVIVKKHLWGSKYQFLAELMYSLMLAVPAFFFAVISWDDSDTVSYLGCGASISIMFMGLLLLLALSLKKTNSGFTKCDLLLMALCTPILTYGGIIQLIGFSESMVLYIFVYGSVIFMHWMNNGEKRTKFKPTRECTMKPWHYLVLALCVVIYVFGDKLLCFELMGDGIDYLIEDNIYPPLYTGIALGIGQVLLAVCLWISKAKDMYARVLVRGVVLSALLTFIVTTCFPL